LAERIADQLHAGAVRIAEVERRPVDVLVLDARVVELLLQTLPSVGRDRDREMVQPAEDLRVLAEVEPGEVEEGERVPVADVEEEVRRPLVVAVLEEVGERELEQVLIEAD